MALVCGRLEPSIFWGFGVVMFLEPMKSSHARPIPGDLCGRGGRGGRGGSGGRGGRGGKDSCAKFI